MEPALREGSVILAVPWPNWLLRPGQVIVAILPDGKTIVKRIKTTVGSDRILLASDNQMTSSQYTRTPILRSMVAGRVLRIR